MCTFPAKQLLQLKRDAVKEADDSNDPSLIESAAQFVLCVDKMRMAHEEMTGCKCWYDAVKQEAA